MAEERKQQILKLYSGDGTAEIPMEEIVKILSRPQVIAVPGAPGDVAGMVYYHNRLIAVKYLEGAERKTFFGCAVLVQGEDGSICGLLADNLSGGDVLDTVYEL